MGGVWDNLVSSKPRSMVVVVVVVVVVVGTDDGKSYNCTHKTQLVLFMKCYAHRGAMVNKKKDEFI